MSNDTLAAAESTVQADRQEVRVGLLGVGLMGSAMAESTAANHWMITMVASLSESMHFCRR